MAPLHATPVERPGDAEAGVDEEARESTDRLLDSPLDFLSSSSPLIVCSPTRKNPGRGGGRGMIFRSFFSSASQSLEDREKDEWMIALPLFLSR